MSRRDDFISLIYLIYYLATGKLLFADYAKGSRDQIMNMKEMKIKSLPKDFLKSGEVTSFIGVADYIFSIPFEAEPNYSKIKFMFT